MTYCENPQCGEAFAPTETANGFCSWECEEQVTLTEDEEN